MVAKRQPKILACCWAGCGKPAIPSNRPYDQCEEHAAQLEIMKRGSILNNIKREV